MEDSEVEKEAIDRRPLTVDSPGVEEAQALSCETGSPSPQPSPQEGEGDKGYTLEEINPCQYQITIQLPYSAIKEKVDVKYQELSKTVSLPGFRPGRVPRKLIERRFGHEALTEIEGNLISERFDQAVEERKLEVLKIPELKPEEIDLDEETGLHWQATFEVKPKLDIQNYTGLTLEREPVVVSEKEVTEAVEQLRLRQAEYIPVENRPPQNGDVLLIDLFHYSSQEALDQNRDVKKLEGVAYPLWEPDYERVSLLFFGQSPPMKVFFALNKNQEKVVEVHGKDGVALAKVVVRDIRERRLPAADDAWAQKLDCPNLEELKTKIRNELGAQKEKEVRHKLQLQIQELLLKANDFTIPEGYVKDMEEKYILNTALNRYRDGHSEEAVQKEISQLRETSRGDVLAFLKRMFILEAIANKEKIFVTDEEVSAVYEGVGRIQKIPPEQVQKFYQEKRLEPSLRQDIRESKVLDFLLEKAVVREQGKEKG